MIEPAVEWKGTSLFVNGRYAGYIVKQSPCSAWGYLWKDAGYHEYACWHLLYEKCQEKLEKSAIERFQRR